MIFWIASLAMTMAAVTANRRKVATRRSRAAAATQGHTLPANPNLTKGAETSR
jgi:hypothetical protein